MDYCKKDLRLNPNYLMGIYAATCLVFPIVAQSMDETEMQGITANWECKWCPYEETASSAGEVNAGAGYVSNDSYKHGDYTGLNEKGAYFVGDLDYGYRGGKGSYSNVEAYDLGLDSRRIMADGGKQGQIDAEVKYSELPKLNLDTARTPYAVGANQTLPAGWVSASDTGGMTELANSLRFADISTQRKTLDLSGDYHQTKSLSYGLSFQRATKEGYRTMGLGIGRFGAGIGSAILAVPVDYVTDQGQVRVNYRKARWQASLSYEFSSFKNETDRVRWENAFTGPAGVTEGQAALEPDNTMQQFSLSGAYHFSESTQASALISMGQLEQNDTFLPYEINGSTAVLPRSSLDGKVNTFAGNLTFNTRFTDNLDFEAQYTQNEQSNDTPRATYDYVVADDPSAPATPRSNMPYGFRQREISVEGRYRLQKPHQFIAGYAYENFDRTYQEVDTTKENTLWGAYRNRMSEKWDWFLRLEASDRSGDEYTQITEGGFPIENDSLRKYYMADRDRKQAKFAVSYLPQPAIQVSFFTDYANDDYSNSEVGLQESEQTNYTLDLHYSFSDALSFNVDYTITNMDSMQAGGSWSAKNDDTVNVAHFGVLYQIIKDKLKLGFDYAYADSEGDISFPTGQTPYPTLTSTRHTFKITGDYNLNERSILNVTYRYEDYSESNWAIDGVAPNTISNVLSMGEVSPDYTIGVLSVSLRYLF
ncbi:MtrB/PioB family decaheme-associated outer membrane protein [Kaarinaea lacus]